MKKITLLLILVFSSFQAFSEEKIVFDDKLCFYEDEQVLNPSRFVYHNKKNNNYVFSFVEENETDKTLKKTNKPYFIKDNIKFSIGKKMVSTPFVDYFEICLSTIK